MLLLSLHNISKRYDSTPAVESVSLTVEHGEFFGLLGPSGCGKTTTLRMIAGLESPDSGKIEFAGSDITRITPEARGFGMVFQNYALFPHLNVFENVGFGLRARRKPANEVAARVAQALNSSSYPATKSVTSANCQAVSSSALPSRERSPSSPPCYCSMNPFQFGRGFARRDSQ